MKYSIKEILSHGFVMGNVKIDNAVKTSVKTFSKEEEKELFLNSIDKSLKEIENMDDNSYLTVQKLMISDPLLRENGLKHIEEGKSAVDSINLVMDEIIKSLENSSSVVIRVLMY